MKNTQTNSNKKYVIGTRTSLLAVTQCTLIQKEIESITGLSFTLDKMKTEGDQKTEKPLWQLDGKDFFTKELDTALLSGQVDLVVHSYKDLGSDRPDNIALAAITKRDYPNDILLIKKETINELKNKEEIIVGTSSPRRIQNIESSLKPLLPGVKDSATVKCAMLRGNVNTRIEKLRSGNYDAIVLAHAGLERLASKEDSKEILKGLLDGLDFMLLPQKIFPSSASQGALAIEFNETRTDDLAEQLKSVHHEVTVEEVSRERKAFQSYGGGCHLAVGIHVRKIQNKFIHIQKGKHQDQEVYKLELEGVDYSPLKGKKAYYVYGEHDFLINKPQIQSETNDEHLFVTSSLCFHNINNPRSIWSGGNRTMQKLIEAGYWVNGSAEGFGHDEVNKYKNSQAIQILIGNADWKVLSHDKAESEVGKTVASYSHEINDSWGNAKESDLLAADIVFWSSKIQFDAYTEKFPSLKDKIHTCGLGKTFTALQEGGIKVIPCIDMKHLRETI